MSVGEKEKGERDSHQLINSSTHQLTNVPAPNPNSLVGLWMNKHPRFKTLSFLWLFRVGDDITWIGGRLVLFTLNWYWKIWEIPLSMNASACILMTLQIMWTVEKYTRRYKKWMGYAKKGKKEKDEKREGKKVEEEEEEEEEKKEKGGEGMRLRRSTRNKGKH